MHRARGGVRGRGDDREGPNSFAARSLPDIPQPGQHHRLLIAPGERVGPLAALHGLPTHNRRRPAPGSARGQRRLETWALSPPSRVNRPMRQETPCQKIEVSLAGLGVAPHCHGLLARRDVPARRHVRHRIDRPYQGPNGARRGEAGVTATLTSRLHRLSGSDRPPLADKIYKKLRAGVSRSAAEMPNRSPPPYEVRRWDVSRLTGPKYF